MPEIDPEGNARARAPQAALNELAHLDKALESGRLALAGQLNAIRHLCGPGVNFAPHFLARLHTMLDHASHLAQRCLDIQEQRRTLLVGKPGNGT